jgi:hypothetical protein
VGTYGAGGNVVAGVVFSAEYFSRINSFSYVDMLGAPTDLTIETGISMPVVAAMRDFAYGYNLLGPSSAASLFPASLQGGLTTAITTLCQTPFGGYLQGAAVHVGDLFDPTFRARERARRSISTCRGTWSRPIPRGPRCCTFSASPT